MQRSPTLPRSPRLAYSASAIIFAGNEQFTCRIVNISISGALLYAPRSLNRGLFLRLNLTLPGVEEIMDVDGVVSRDSQHQGYYTLAIKFYQPSKEFETVLATFLCWLRQQHKAPEAERIHVSRVRAAQVAKPRAPPVMRPTPAPRPAAPRSRAEQRLQQRTTGPDFPRVTTRSLREALETLKSHPSGKEQLRLHEEVEARWRKREQEELKRKELKRLYHDALKDMGTGCKG